MISKGFLGNQDVYPTHPTKFCAGIEDTTQLASPRRQVVDSGVI